MVYAVQWADLIQALYIFQVYPIGWTRMSPKGVAGKMGSNATHETNHAFWHVSARMRISENKPHTRIR